MPWSEVIPAAFFLFFGLAIVPVVLVLTATWLPRLFAGAHRTDKQPAARNRSIDGTGAMCLARFSSRPCAWQVS